MNIVIVEAGTPTMSRVKRFITQLLPEVNILGTANSIKASVELFKQHNQINMAFIDIELADGPSIEIFNQVNVTCPVIFTTPYDEYALKAFIAYTLKGQIEMTDVSSPTLIIKP